MATPHVSHTYPKKSPAHTYGVIMDENQTKPFVTERRCNECGYPLSTRRRRSAGDLCDACHVEMKESTNGV